ncbi:hypothetical protein GVN24_24690 [Rhizobium sp. CRIBSB]|nr:hypothetical protein [Rhizobium sp. CRIBSB]
MIQLIPYLSLAVAVAAVTISAWVAVRAARWRDLEALSNLVTRIDGAEDRISRLETSHAELATKADLAGLKGELHAVCKQIDQRVVPGLDRIEGYFLKMGVERGQ